MPASFDPSILELLRGTEEVDIETRAAEDAPWHRVIIWVVVDDADRVFVRSVRGPAGRWFREVVSHPACMLHADGRAIPAQAVAATDDEQVETCSRALVAKYVGGPSVVAMLRPEVLPTTLRLVPR